MARKEKMYRVRISHESFAALKEFNGERTVGPVLEENDKTVLLEVDPQVYEALCFKGKTADEVIAAAIAAWKAVEGKA